MGALILLTLVACNKKAEDDGGIAHGLGGGVSRPDFELPADHTPWTVRLFDYDCHHVDVEERCREGWCLIPAGCFIMGSPEDEPGRGLTVENQVPVELTHSLAVMQTELTQEFWSRLIPQNPSGPAAAHEPSNTPAGWTTDCVAPDCPVGHVSWYEAVSFANLLSKRDGLEACYLLDGCTGTIGAREADPFTCTGYEQTTTSIYACGGYRLPTEAEHEYFTRAGTSTAIYSGDVPEEYLNECQRPLATLDAIAWYCQNANNTTHPVAQKLPNRWGLHDALGNVFEWGTGRLVLPSNGAPPWTDPYAGTGNGLSSSDSHLMEGGYHLLYPDLLRVAARGSNGANGQGPAFGFRLVRSLSPAEARDW